VYLSNYECVCDAEVNSDLVYVCRQVGMYQMARGVAALRQARMERHVMSGYGRAVFPVAVLSFYVDFLTEPV